MFDLRQTKEYAKYMESIGWTVEGKSGQFAYIRRFPIIGNFLKLQRPEQFNDRTIEQLAKKIKPFQFIIEPRNEHQASSIKYLGFKQSKTYFVPSKTIQIDLTKSEKQLLKEMHHKTRYNIKQGKRSKVKVERLNDIKSFASFWQECAVKQRGMFLDQKKEIIEIHKAFGKNAHLILATKKKRILSGILVICTKNTAYYMYAASTDEGKRLFAPSLNVWECIKLAKKLGCKIFDFEGIYDERFPIKSWHGFTRFKRSFGGMEIAYPGAFQKLRFSFFNFLSI